MEKIKIAVVIVLVVAIVLFNKLTSKENNYIEEENVNFSVVVKGEVENPGIYEYSNEVTINKVIEDAGGFTTEALEDEIELYNVLNSDYTLNVNKIEKKKIIVEISGEVLAPGIYELDENSRTIDLLNLAHGFTAYAVKDINLAKILKDGERIEVTRAKESVVSSNEDIIQKEKSDIVVEIKGEVLYPGVYKLSNDSIINDLINMAGGLTKRANTDNLNLAKLLKNEDLIVIEKNQKYTSVSGKTNINFASKSDLEKLPGIGETLSERIIEYRKNKMFTNTSELLNIDNFSAATYEKIKELITV